MRITNRELRSRIRKILLERIESPFDSEERPSNVVLKFDYPNSVSDLLTSSGQYNHREFYSLKNFTQDIDETEDITYSIEKSATTYAQALGPGEIATVLLFYPVDDTVRKAISDMIVKYGLYQLDPVSKGAVINDFYLPDVKQALMTTMGVTDKTFMDNDYSQVFGFADFASLVLGGANTTGDIALTKIPDKQRLKYFSNISALDSSKDIVLRKAGLTNLYTTDLEAKAGTAKVGGQGNQAVNAVLKSPKKESYGPLKEIHDRTIHLGGLLGEILTLEISKQVNSKLPKSQGGIATYQGRDDAKAETIKELLNILTGYSPANTPAMHNELFRTGTASKIFAKLQKGGYTNSSFSTLYSYLSANFIPAIVDGDENQSRRGYSTQRATLNSNTFTNKIEDSSLIKDLSIKNSQELNTIIAACDNLLNILSTPNLRRSIQGYNLPSFETVLTKASINDIVTNGLISKMLDDASTSFQPAYEYFLSQQQTIGASINDLYTIFSNKGANSLLNDESLEVVIMCFAEGVDSYRKVYDHNLAQIAAQLQIVKQTLAAHYSSGSIEIIKHLSSALRENIRSAFPQDQLIINVNVKSQSAFILSPATAQAVGVEVSMTDNFVIKPHFTTSAESGANIIKIKVV